MVIVGGNIGDAVASQLPTVAFQIDTTSERKSGEGTMLK